MSSANLLPFNGEVYYHSRVFDGSECAYYLGELTKNIHWKQEPVRLFGKEIMQPRLTAWYGNPGKSYTYSGVTMGPKNWTKALLDIKKKVEQLSGVNFSSVLLNLYRNGNDYMGWHRDNEKPLGAEPVIASVSFGAPRTFQLRHYSDNKHNISLLLEPGSVLLMKGKTQQFWEHRLPKATRLTEPRINLTLRDIK